MNFNEFKAAYKECVSKGMLDHEIVAFAKQSGMDGVTILRYIHLIQSGAGLPDIVKGKAVKNTFRIGFMLYGIVFLYAIWQIFDFMILKGIPKENILAAPSQEASSLDFLSVYFFPINFFQAHLYVLVPLLVSFFALKKSYVLRSKTLFVVGSLTWFLGVFLLGYFLYQTGWYPNIYMLENIY